MKLTESQLRVIVKQELKKVLFENVQNVDDVDVEALIDSFDELKYADDEYGENIYKFKNGQKIGELTQPEIDAIDEHMDEITDTFRVSLNNFDATEQAAIISKAFGKKDPSKYIRTKEELLASQASREAAAKKQKERYAELRRKNDEYFKKNPI